MNKKKIDRAQIKVLFAEYYKSIPTGRALGELRFYLQKSIEKCNYALSFNSIEEIVKNKEELELKLSKLDKKRQELDKNREA